VLIKAKTRFQGGDTNTQKGNRTKNLGGRVAKLGHSRQEQIRTRLTEIRKGAARDGKISSGNRKLRNQLLLVKES